MIDLSLAPRNRLLQNLSMKRGRSIYKGDDDRYYLSDNVMMIDIIFLIM